MTKTLLSTECEINASPKTLFPFLDSPSLLEKWFADEVKEEEDGTLTFIWDEEGHRAKKASRKENHFVKFEFLEDSEDPSWLELRIEVNALTNSTYLKIEEYSEIDDVQDLHELYNHCLATLKEIVGGNV